jgi:hypothetical protein
VNNLVNQVAYLRSARSFPEDLTQLTVEINKAYLDIANAVNSRTIGIFSTNRPAITGESWFLINKRQQTLRQVYEISSYATFNHNIDFKNVFSFTVIRAIGFDGVSNYFPIPFVNAGTATVGIYVTPTQVIFIPGVGAPALTRGIVILEWLSSV